MSPRSCLPTALESGVSLLDRQHTVFLEGLQELSRAPDADFIPLYRDFLRQAEIAFRIEENWMEQQDLPIIKSHREQHARVLGALHHVHSRILDGDLPVGREVVKRLLPRWFALHITTMDAELATAMRASDSNPDTRSLPE